nr:MAG TPA: hypothetical protein [Caudoviricetes sp.]
MHTVIIGGDCSRPHCVGLNNNMRYSFPQQHLSK